MPVSSVAAAVAAGGEKRGAKINGSRDARDRSQISGASSRATDSFRCPPAIISLVNGAPDIESFRRPSYRKRIVREARYILDARPDWRSRGSLGHLVSAKRAEDRPKVGISFRSGRAGGRTGETCAKIDA